MKKVIITIVTAAILAGCAPESERTFKIVPGEVIYSNPNGLQITRIRTEKGTYLINNHGGIVKEF